MNYDKFNIRNGDPFLVIQQIKYLTKLSSTLYRSLAKVLYSILRDMDLLKKKKTKKTDL